MANAFKYKIEEERITINGITRKRSFIQAMAENWSYKEISQYFGVSTTLIQEILKAANIKKKLCRTGVTDKITQAMDGQCKNHNRKGLLQALQAGGW